MHCLTPYTWLIKRLAIFTIWNLNIFVFTKRQSINDVTQFWRNSSPIQLSHIEINDCSIFYKNNESYVLVAGPCFQDGIQFFVSAPLEDFYNVTAYLCQVYCQNVPGCVRFTFSKDTAICYLSGSYEGIVYVDPQYTSGPQYCTGSFYFPLLLFSIWSRINGKSMNLYYTVANVCSPLDLNVADQAGVARSEAGWGPRPRSSMK